MLPRWPVTRMRMPTMLSRIAAICRGLLLAIISPGRTVVAMIGLAIATYGWTAPPRPSGPARLPTRALTYGPKGRR